MKFIEIRLLYYNKMQTQDIKFSHTRQLWNKSFLNQMLNINYASEWNDELLSQSKSISLERLRTFSQQNKNSLKKKTKIGLNGTSGNMYMNFGNYNFPNIIYIGKGIAQKCLKSWANKYKILVFAFVFTSVVSTFKVFFVNTFQFHTYLQIRYNRKIVGSEFQHCWFFKIKT